MREAGRERLAVAVDVAHQGDAHGKASLDPLRPAPKRSAGHDRLSSAAQAAVQRASSLNEPRHPALEPGKACAGRASPPDRKGGPVQMLSRAVFAVAALVLMLFALGL